MSLPRRSGQLLRLVALEAGRRIEDPARPNRPVRLVGDGFA